MSERRSVTREDIEAAFDQYTEGKATPDRIWDALHALLPTFEVGQVVGELQPGRRPHDWCSIHGDIGPMESIDGHAHKHHGSSAEDIRKARKVIKRARAESDERVSEGITDADPPPGPQTDQGKWLIAHQGLVNIGKWDGSMRGDEIDLRACVVTIEAEARAAGVAEEHERHGVNCPARPASGDVEAAWEALRLLITEGIDATEEIDAFEAAIRAESGGLDAAWAAAVAALPAGWALWGVRFRAPGRGRARGQYEAWAGPVGLKVAAPWPRPSRGLSGYSADSPAAALSALAARLAEGAHKP